VKARTLAGWVILLLAVSSRFAHASDHRGAQLLTITNLLDFARQSGASPNERVLLSGRLRADFPWRELVASWNTEPGVALTVEARALRPEGPTRYYVLGRWSADPDLGPRASVPGQMDPDGEVQTDVLVLTRPAQEFELRLTLRGVSSDNRGLKFLVVSLLDPAFHAPALPPNRTAWGRVLKVPIRSQADYPEGVKNWCSPTSTAMLLAYWGQKLDRPALDWQVPHVARLVEDPEWPGTGNWPFNTAFAGLQPGLRACVSRFTDVAEIEEWIAQGLPLAASVSYAQLLGQPNPKPGDGHLVVVAGFTKKGDVVVNDPGVRRARVRRTIPRSAFDNAWARSHRTVYLVWPEGVALPENSRGHW
jgi:hypothetical protein